MAQGSFGLSDSSVERYQNSLVAGRHGLVGSVTCLDEALRLIHQKRPSLLICSEHLEDGTGNGLIREPKSFDNRVKALLLLEHCNPMLYASALAAYPDGIMLEPMLGRGNLLLALRMICEGGIYLEPEIANALHGSASDGDPGLSSRELEVMQQVVHGLSDRQIAEHLKNAVPTVKYHLQQVYQKLSVHNRTRAAIALLLLGIVEPPYPLLPCEAAALGDSTDSALTYPEG